MLLISSGIPCKTSFGVLRLNICTVLHLPTYTCILHHYSLKWRLKLKTSPHSSFDRRQTPTLSYWPVDLLPLDLKRQIQSISNSSQLLQQECVHPQLAMLKEEFYGNRICCGWRYGYMRKNRGALRGPQLSRVAGWLKKRKKKWWKLLSPWKLGSYLEAFGNPSIVRTSKTDLIHAWLFGIVWLSDPF